MAKRKKRIVEDTEFCAFVRRVIRAYAKRAGDDVEALPSLVAIEREVNNALREAVSSLRRDHSLSEIASRLGTTRQAVHKRFPLINLEEDCSAEATTERS